ncbi:MAG: RimK family protein [Gammaproteobacteria bacterium]|nr:RimK family protein [Gammaproteobacteria bacterium]
MTKQLKIVVEHASDWRGLYPSDDVILASEYLAMPPTAKAKTRVINLCRDYGYLSAGYYTSLLAEARAQRVVPSVKHMQDLSRRIWSTTISVDAAKALETAAAGADEVKLMLYFGTTQVEGLTMVARRLFEQLSVPILLAQFQKVKGAWRLGTVSAVGIHKLSDTEQTEFAQSLDHYSRLIWRKPRSNKQSRYDLAILVDPEEPFAPSNSVAISRFVKAGKKLGIHCETITRKDLGKLGEYDALFIRATTSVNHYTYKFARIAQAEGLVVMDDPDSILRCTNKIYLSQLLDTHGVPTPKTQILAQSDLAQLDTVIANMGLPMVLKVPDGSFSVGVHKVADSAALESTLKQMFKSSALVLAQQYLPTQFDWRIGVLNNQALYACRYYMVKNHWQIYHHGAKGTQSGGYDVMPTYEVPAKVIKTALAATKLIGNGLYGVDLKQSADGVYIIEVNDNPSIESAVEDRVLEQGLYETIMAEFKRRLDQRGL